MLNSKKVIVLAIGLAACSFQAQATPIATPIFTLSSFTFGSSVGEVLAGAATAGSAVLVAAFDSVVNSTPTYTTVVTLAPTHTTTGLASTYEHYTTTTTHTAASYTDNASYAVSNSASSIAPDQQYIRLTGIVTANVATTLTYQLIAGGMYASTSDTRHTTILPSEVGLWFNDGPAAASVANSQADTLLSSTRALSPGLQYVQTSSLYSITMAAGQKLYVAADVETSTGSSLSNFALNFTSAAYGGQSQAPTYANVNNMYLTSVLGTIPEPETHAMFLAGLGIMGFLGRRKKKIA